MAEEQTTENGENIGPVEAYHILWQRQREENRLLSERTTIFLAASSILFLAFVMLLNPSLVPAFKALRIGLPFFGMFLTLVFYSLAKGTVNTLKFLWDAQEDIERNTPEFSYMRENRIAPQIHRSNEETQGKNLWRRITFCLSKHASKKWLPLTFGILWVASLIVACLS